MLRRPHCCAFLIGTVLVLLAVLALVRTDRVSHHRPAPDPARLALAVAHLNSACLTCHSDLSAGPDLVPPAQVARPAADWLAAAARQPEASTQTTPLLAVSAADSPSSTRAPAVASDPRLLDLGWRLLSLPPGQQARAGAVIDSFVLLASAQHSSNTAYAAGAQFARAASVDSSAAPEDSAALSALLADLEAAVRDLEHRAAPEQWTAAAVCPLDGQALAALQQAPHMLSVSGMPETGVTLARVPADAWTVIETPHLGLPYEIIFGTQRRGPPGDGFAGDSAAGASVLAAVYFPLLDTRECYPLGGSLSFFVWRAAHHQTAGLKQFLPYPVVQRGYYVT